MVLNSKTIEVVIVGVIKKGIDGNFIVMYNELSKYYITIKEEDIEDAIIK